MDKFSGTDDIKKGIPRDFVYGMREAANYRRFGIKPGKDLDHIKAVRAGRAVADKPAKYIYETRKLKKIRKDDYVIAKALRGLDDIEKKLPSALRATTRPQ